MRVRHPTKQPLRAALVALAFTLLTASLAWAQPAPRADPTPQKVLRVAFPSAENGFDPVQANDGTTITLVSHIFEGLYGYDPLAPRPVLVPVAAAAMPQVSDDHRTWVIPIRPGNFFADDPAFQGRPRELVAEDFIYTFKRMADPATKSSLWTALEANGISGLSALRQRVLAEKKPFDYAAPVPGLRALDRHTLQIRLDAPRPRLLLDLTGYGSPAMAREVVEFYGSRIAEHPVGTGPFRLAQWRRSSLVVLERNPRYTGRVFDGQPAPDDAEGQALLARFKGRALPMIDRVEASIIEAGQPRWLSFLDGQIDVLAVPADFVRSAAPGGELAPFLARRGVALHRRTEAASNYLMFNMRHPVVGGLAPERVALRRAMALGMDAARMIEDIDGGQGLLAQSPIGVGLTGHDPGFRSENGDHDPARAKALLDLYGWVDRDGDGWREQPDGQPLVLELATQTDARSRAMSEALERDMRQIGVRMRFKPAQFVENIKAVRAGRYTLFAVRYGPVKPDAQDVLDLLSTSAIGGFNLTAFSLPAMDQAIDRLSNLPDGAERDAQFREVRRMAVAWMPMKTWSHFQSMVLTQPRLVGYRGQPFVADWYQRIDLADPP